MRVLHQAKLLTAALLALTFAGSVQAAEAPTPIARDWPHAGVFGTFDRPALQRGLQVYTAVCASCHGLRFMAFRNLGALGYSEAEVQAIAATFEVEDGPDDFGEMFTRPAAPFDSFPSPHANEQAARAANGGALPPDLSLITKARVGGEDYIYSLLVGYDDAPAGFEVMPGMHYNTFFPGHQIAMAQPLWPDMVEYADGTEASLSQMASDVSQFLHWVAEPQLEARKQTGIKVLLFLLVLAIIFYAYKRRVWRDVH